MNGGADCAPDLYKQLNGKGSALSSVSAPIDSSEKVVAAYGYDAYGEKDAGISGAARTLCSISKTK